jgi:hypothetical protein
MISTARWLPAFLAVSLVARAAPAGDRPWQRIQVPGVEAAYRAFSAPPPEYAMVLWWFWNGAMTPSGITHDLEDMHAHGVSAVMVFPYYGLSIEYLSPTWFERIRFAVQEARRLNMRVWLTDEGAYPSGFVGGKVTRERPDLRMRILVAGERFVAHEGDRVSMQRGPAVLAGVAVESSTGRRVPIPAASTWTAPPGVWQVRTVQWEYRTSPTRHANRAGFLKDSMYSMFDPLHPAGSRFFLDSVHEQYRKVIGDEFGRTVLGFMGDEPSVAGLPWTGSFLEEFSKRKGYDLAPHLPSLVYDDLQDPTVRADYFDVWTDLYDEGYFRPQAEWCARNNLEYIVHLCGEEDTPTLIKLNGDYFKANRAVHIPGVDAIWRQIWPGKTENYPKLASTAAHLHGRPRAFTESYAVYGQGLSLAQARWVFDYQAVRGINNYQAMEYLSSPAEFRLYFHPPDWPAGPLWPYFGAFSSYVSRVCALLSLGRPAARLALYFPTTSGWAADFEPDRQVWSLARQLTESQRDFDFIDEDALQGGLTLDGPRLRNQSGQSFQAVIVPPVTFLSVKARDTLTRFSAAGGRVLFLGAGPRSLAGRSFRDAQPPAAPIPPATLDQLPPSDVILSPPAPAVKVLHRSLQDAEVYFFFNEADSEVETNAMLEGRGTRAELWDPETGERSELACRRAGPSLEVGLRMMPHGTALVALTSSTTPLPRASSPRLQTLLTLDGDWEIQVAGKRETGPLRLWADLGLAAYSGTATYTRRFTVPQRRGTVFLDLGDVRYAAAVRLNGHHLGRRAWPPFRWNLTPALAAGENLLEIEVANTRANELADPAAYKQIESRGWLKNSYVPIYLKFDREMVPSGLLGPVRVSLGQP